MTVKEALDRMYIKYKLSPLDVEILLSLAGNMSKEYILAHPEKKMSPAQVKKFSSFCLRRSKGEPIAYISRTKEFFGLDFILNKNVLIPRPETELLTEYALKKILDTKYPPTGDHPQGDQIPNTIIDVGTGSGNIIISVIKNIPEKIQRKIRFYAVDISREALKVAKVNAKKHKVDKKIKFIQSDLLEYFFPPKADQPLAEKNKIKLKNVFILANLPYVSPVLYLKNKDNLSFEPVSALYSRNSGLAHYKKILQQISLLITERCSLIFEISPEQKFIICQIIRKIWPKARIEFYKDFAGKWRIVEIVCEK